MISAFWGDLWNSFTYFFDRNKFSFLSFAAFTKVHGSIYIMVNLGSGCLLVPGKVGNMFEINLPTEAKWKMHNYKKIIGFGFCIILIARIS